MGYCVATFFFVYGIAQHYRQKTWIAPDVIYALQWGTISLLASLQLFGLNPVREKVWMMVLLGGMAFILGSWGASSTNWSDFKVRVFRSEFASNSKHNDDYLMQRKVFWFLFIIIFVIELYFFRNVMGFIQQGISLSVIRGALYGETTLSGYARISGGIATMLEIFRMALRHILIANGICLTVISTKKDLKPLIAAAILAVLNAVSSGGRFILAYFMLELLVCMFLEKKKLSMTRKIFGKKILLLLGLIFFAMGYAIMNLSVSRGILAQKIYEHLYGYACGDIPFLDAIIDFVDERPMTFGMLGLYGFWTIFFPSLHYFGIPYPSFYLETAPFIQNTIVQHQISATRWYNAFATPFYYLYADFRWLGIIAGMLFFGFIAGRYFSKVQESINPANVVPYLLIVQMIFKSLQQYPLTSSAYVVILLLLYMMSHTKLVCKNR